MPKIRRSRTKKAPEGFEEIEPTLEEMDRKMRDLENTSHEGLKRNETVWAVLRLNHQRSRYIWERYKAKEITRELYDWLIKEKYADAGLIAKWKKSGYESLCCVQCIQTKDTNFGTTCICRVPRGQLEEGVVVECKTCGCRGCGG